MNFSLGIFQNVTGKRNSNVEELEKFRRDIAVLSETKRKEIGTGVSGNYIHFYSSISKDRRAKRGLSTFIKNR